MVTESGRRILLTMLFVVALLPGTGLAQTPIGSEFQVNQYTTSHQQYPSVAAASDGGFVVVWQGDPELAGAGTGIFGRRYDGSGSAVGGDFEVNGDTAASAFRPGVASDAAGNFVVVWHGYDDQSSDYEVFGRRFNSSGSPIGGDFRVNGYTTASQAEPAVAAAADGGFVVVWQSAQKASGYNVVAQRFDNAGSALGDEFQVNTTVAGSQTEPAVASDSTGNFVVAWEDSAADGDSAGVFARRFRADGTALGGEFQVNEFTQLGQKMPSIASDPNGNFVIAWEGGASQDGSGYGVFARRFAADGSALGNEFQVNTYTANDQSPPPTVTRVFGTSRLLPGDLRNAMQLAQASASSSGSRSSGGSSGSRSSGGSNGARRLVVPPSVAADVNGNFVISWASEAQDGSGAGVFGQRFDHDGVPVGNEFQVNTYTAGDQSNPAVAHDAQGNVVIAWDSFGQDGSGLGVFAQRYAGPTHTPTPIPTHTPTPIPTHTPTPPPPPTETPTPPPTHTPTPPPATPTPTATPRTRLKPLLAYCEESAECHSDCCFSILPPSNGLCMPKLFCP